ncbi:hypothetical protein Q9Q99_13040 [Curtobacterium flaccumfaciens]|nr:hypothetical protein Q9Q99_13040 [Curtobacterium flaccumfaciens]
MRELGEHAASVGLPMALELYEDTYLGTADGAVRLVEEIGLDNVGLNADVAEPHPSAPSRRGLAGALREDHAAHQLPAREELHA